MPPPALASGQRFVDPDEVQGQQPPGAPKMQLASGGSFVDPDDQPAQKGIGIAETAGRTSGGTILEAERTAMRTAGGIWNYIAQGINSVTGKQTVDPHGGDTLMDTMDRVDKMVRPLTDFKANETPSVTGQILGGAMSLPAQVLAWPQHSIDRYLELKDKGASDADAIKAVAPTVAFDYAMQVAPFHAAAGPIAGAVARVGGGKVAQYAAGAAGGGALGIGLGSAERATENAALPEGDQYQKPVEQGGMRENVMPSAADLPQAGFMAAAGIMGVHGARAERAAKAAEDTGAARIAEIHADADMTPAQKMQAIADIARQVQAATPPNFDIPPGERGVPRLSEGKPVAGGINVSEMGAPEEIQAAPAPAEPPAPRGPYRTEMPESFVDERPEAAPPVAVAARPAGKEVENVKAAPPPGAPKSERQVELERLRGLAEEPATQKILDTQIAAEEKASAQAHAEQVKRESAQASAEEMRRLAARSGDPAIADDLLARAEKLDPSEKAEAAPAPAEPRQIQNRERVTGEVVGPDNLPLRGVGERLLEGPKDRRPAEGSVDRRTAAAEPPENIEERRAAERRKTSLPPEEQAEISARAEAAAKAPPNPHAGKFFDELPPEEQAARRAAVEASRTSKAAAPATPPPEAGTPSAPQAGAAPEVHTTRSSPLFHAMHDDLGGVHKSEMADIGIDKSVMSKDKWAFSMRGKNAAGKTRGWLFNDKGARMDRVTEWMEQHGYLSQHDIDVADHTLPGGAHELARELIRKEARDPGSVKPRADESDEMERQVNAKREAAMLNEAARFGIDTTGKTPAQVEAEIGLHQDHEHAAAHGVDEMTAKDLEDAARLNELNPDLYEALAMKHQDAPDHRPFMQDVRRELDAHDATVSSRPRSDEPGPNRETQEPAVRGEPAQAEPVRGESDALRDQRGAGNGEANGRTAAGREIPGAGADRGGAAAAEARGALEHTYPDRERTTSEREKAWGELGNRVSPGIRYRLPVELAKKRLDATIDRIKQVLDKNGLGWTHKDTDYAIDDKMAVGTASAVVGDDGRYQIRAHPSVMDEHPNLVAKVMLHEHAHVIDWNGLLYSSHPDMEMRVGADGKIEPVGAVAKELVAAAKKDSDLRKFFAYPLDEGNTKLHKTPWKVQAEMFAQAVVARRSDMREALQREAPETSKFVDQALAHAAEEGHAPGADVNAADLGRLEDSFARSRQSGGLRGDGDRADQLKTPLESRQPEAEKDQKEAREFMRVLQKNFTPKELQRMLGAAKDQDLASLPAKQRDVMEFLAGRGYEPTLLERALGAKYAPYQNVAKTITKDSGPFGDSLRKIFAPASRGDIAEAQAGIMRPNFGEQARQRELAFEKMKEYAKQFSKLSNADNVKFIDAMERGTPITDPKLAAAAKALRELLDTKRDEVRDLGTGKLEDFDANYFPHIWKQHDEAMQLFARRPLEGSKAFLKQRTVPYTTDGLRWRAYDDKGEFVKSYDTKAEAEANMPEGGRVGEPMTPISSNPVELALLKAREMDRYIYGQRIFQEMKAQGLAQLVPHGAREPAGFTRINDKIAQGGREGVYYAPDQAATLLNNHLSPGLQGNSAYQAFRQVGNMLNQAQLGLSAFHAGFTTMDSMVSKVALGAKQIARGDVLKGASNVAQGMLPTQAVVNLINGDRLLKAYLGKLDSPEMAPIVAALQQAGGRVRQDDFYRNTAVNAFSNALRNRDALGAAKTFLPHVMDLISHPIMGELVPRQKLGVFFDMAKDHIQTHPDEEVGARTAALGKLWDSVDNRMGQLVYDNLFWNRTLKDGLMASVRSVGWNLGTIRELGGGVADLKDVKKLGGISDRTAYTVALPLVAGIYGAITQQLYGAAQGKSIEESMPESMKDMFFPRTGKIRPDGSEDRVSLPTYMKDIYAYGNDLSNWARYGGNPAQTITNKLHPIFSTIAQMLQNEDFFGAAIRNPADPAVRQIKDVANYVVKQVEPFSARNFEQQQKEQGKSGSITESPTDYLSSPSMFGVAPAPGYITKSPEQIESGQVSRLREPLINKFKEEIRDNGLEADLIPRMKASGLSKQDMKFVLRSATPSQRHRLKHFGEAAAD